MPETQHKLAVVIPTIGRYTELRYLLESLNVQTRWPEQVIIVDQDETSERFVAQFPALNIRVIALPGSACLKRNAGFRTTRSDADLIVFTDDDIVLEPQAIEALMNFWDKAPSDVGGASCNWANSPKLFARRLKTLRLTSLLGLYEPTVGSVSRSGFGTLVTEVEGTAYVQWLPSGAVCFRRRVLEEFSFDEWYESYSYLEDLDLSYRIGKKYRLAVVADARFYHYPSAAGRPNPYLFGKKEVLNRLHFVSKHPELSSPACYLALLVRATMSIFLGITRQDPAFFRRVAGNIAGVLLAQNSSRRAHAQAK